MTPPKNVQPFPKQPQIMNDMIYKDKYASKQKPTYTPTSDGYVEVKYPDGKTQKVSEYEAFIMQHINDNDMFNENSKAKEEYQNMQVWLKHLDALDGDESDGITKENWNKYVAKYGFRKAEEFFVNIANGDTDKVPRELAEAEMTLQSQNKDLQLARKTLFLAYSSSIGAGSSELTFEEFQEKFGTWENVAKQQMGL